MRLFKYVCNDYTESITAIKAAVILFHEFNDDIPIEYLILEVIELVKGEEIEIHNKKIICD